MVVGQELFASGGEVYVTQLGPTSAAYTEELFVQSPANGFGMFLNNHTTANGTTYDLGSYAAGTGDRIRSLRLRYSEYLVLTALVRATLTEPVHAYMVNNYEGLANTT